MAKAATLFVYNSSEHKQNEKAEAAKAAIVRSAGLWLVLSTEAQIYTLSRVYITSDHILKEEDDYEKNKQLCLTQKFHVHAREDFLDEDEIALFLKAGLDINTWGVKNRFRYAYFKEKGVNIVIANKNFKKLKM